MAIEGVDYAFPPRPDPAALVAAGKRFAVRYGGPGTEDKWLHLDEAMALAAAGISIVANAEGSASGLLSGWSAGAAWASKADAWFRSCGMPDGRPIYLSVDFDVSSAQWPAVANALRGAASVVGLSRVGVYGGRRAIEWARRDGVASWFWQTYAWSAGVWVPGNHLEQYRNGVTIGGADCDLDRALQADFGQWFPVGAMEEDDMLTPEDIPTLQLSPWQYRNAEGVADWAKNRPGVWYPDMHAVVWGIHNDVQALKDKLAALEAGGVDVAALAKALAPLLPAPPTAEQVADVLAARLKD